MTTVEVVTSLDDIEPEWDALVERIAGSPFMRPGWLGTYWRTRQARTPLRIVTVRDEGRLVALAPLHVVGRRLCSLGHTAQTPFEPPAEPGYESVLAQALLREGRHRATLTYIPETSPLLPELSRSAEDSGWRIQIRSYERTTEIDLSGGITQLTQQLSRKSRRELERREHRLAELGEVAYTVHDGSSALGEHLDELFAVEASGWKGPSGTGTAIACSIESRSFFTEFATWAAEHGLLRLSFLRLDGRVIAGRIGVEAHSIRYGIRTGYDEDYARYAPASLLVYRILQDLSERGLDRFVFLGRDEPHKTRWSDTAREHLLVHLFPPTVAGRAQWAAYTYVRPVVVSVRERLHRGKGGEGQTPRPSPAT